MLGNGKELKEKIISGSRDGFFIFIYLYIYIYFSLFFSCLLRGFVGGKRSGEAGLGPFDLSWGVTDCISVAPCIIQSDRHQHFCLFFLFSTSPFPIRLLTPFCFLSASGGQTNRRNQLVFFPSCLVLLAKLSESRIPAEESYIFHST